MCEEEKEKPDWLSDLQNNQKHKERENDDDSLDLSSPVLAYASPRYGRRSMPGTKSVDNSPTKSSSNENKYSARSNSARPLRVQDECIRKAKENDIAFNKSLDILRDDFEKLTLYNFPEERSNSRSDSKRFNENWEGSWNSRELIGAAQKQSAPEEVHEKQINKIITSSQQRINEARKGKTNLRNKKSESIKNQLKFEKVGRANGAESKEKNRQDFIIPELPQGQNLVINIKTTWGDKHFLGMNGIEIFNSKGKKPQIKSISENLDKIDCKKDPKTVENLIDNVYLTQDDTHMWLAPYTPHSNHLIFITFDKKEELAMLRIWNYNKSRIHCYRGVKDVEMKLDNQFIFVGEIAMASGEILNTLNSFGDTILFTTDEGILELVAENDEFFSSNAFCTLEDSLTMEEMRPLTGGNGDLWKTTEPGLSENQSKLSKENSADLKKKFDEDTELWKLKPSMEFDKSISEKNYKEGVLSTNMKTEVTSKTKKKKLSQHLEVGLCFGDQITSLPDNSQTWSEKVKEIKFTESDSIFGKAEFFDETGTLYIPSVCTVASDSVYETLSMPTGYNFTIQIHSTWGDLYYVGLNGVQVFDENGVEVKLHPENVRAEPEGVNILDGIENDIRTPDKLIDGVNETTDGCHMWLAPVLPLTINRVELIFQRPVTLSSMKLWNYSKTPCRGVREFGILVDGLLIYNGELNQAQVMTTDGLPRIPCKTIHFSDSDGRKNNEDFFKPQRAETSSGALYLVDQSKRPLTTVTSHS